MANPSSLPLSWGRTFPTARAAPVVVGMMFSAAARDRGFAGCAADHVEAYRRELRGARVLWRVEGCRQVCPCWEIKNPMPFRRKRCRHSRLH